MNEIIPVTGRGEEFAIISPESMNKALDQVGRLVREVLRPKRDYMTVAGNPMLTKVGCERVCFAFGFVPEMSLEVQDHEDWHRDYRATCRLTRRDGTMVAQWVGECSTRDAKYAQRTGGVQVTGLPVPKKYWELKKKLDENEDDKAVRTEIQRLLSSNYQAAGNSAPSDAFFLVVKSKKGTGPAIAIRSEKHKVDNDAIGDVYKTCSQMAQARALRGAVRVGAMLGDVVGGGGDKGSTLLIRISGCVTDGNPQEALRLIYRRVTVLSKDEHRELLVLRSLAVSAFKSGGLDSEALIEINKNFGEKGFPALTLDEIGTLEESDDDADTTEASATIEGEAASSEGPEAPGNDTPAPVPPVRG